MQRPLGVTILAVLNIIAGLIGLLSSLFMLGLFGLGGTAIDPQAASTGAGAALFTKRGRKAQEFMNFEN